MTFVVLSPKVFLISSVVALDWLLYKRRRWERERGHCHNRTTTILGSLVWVVCHIPSET